jgi:hypothetical protein
VCFGGVAAILPEAAVTLQLDRIQNFLREFSVANAITTNGNEQMEKFYVWTIFCAC